MKLKFKSITNLIAKFTPLALFAVLGLALAAPQTAQADQWFRFTITQKSDSTQGAPTTKYIQLDEFGLFDASFTEVSRGLTVSTAASEAGVNLPAGKFRCRDTSGNPANMFAGGTTKWCVVGDNYAYPLNEDTCPQFTIHLADGKGTVVGYNLRSGNDTTSSQASRAPTAWLIEYSSDGNTWYTFDRHEVESSQGDKALNTANTWYADGGSSSDTPTKIYGRGGIVVTKNDTFLLNLMQDPRIVDPSTEEMPATGGNLVLKDGADYIHVFAEPGEQTFTLNQNSTARILAVGGGGAGGAQGGPNGRSGGGGAGGYVEQSNVALQTGDYTLQVGAGGSAVTYKYGEDRQGVSGQSSWLKRGDAFVVPEALGGGGGGAGSLPGLSGGSGGGGAHSAGGAGTTGQGYAGGGTTYPNNHGSGGGGAADAGVRVGGAAKTSDILGTEYAFAGGGGGANLYTGTEYKGGGATISGAMVYVGGSGGTTSSGEDGKAGVAGTGSGGGGSGRNMGGDSIHSGAGGSGIVIIRVTSGSPVGPTPVSDLTVEFSSASYTGNTIDPTITIKNGGTTVASGTASAINSGSYDLTVAWPSGVTIENAGDYTLTVTGGGTTYTGSKTATFTVAKCVLTPSATATSTYAGYPQTCPHPKVDGKGLGTFCTFINGQQAFCGTYNVTYTLKDQNNYAFPGSASTFEVIWTFNKGNNEWKQVPAISSSKWSIYGGAGTLTKGRVKWGSLTSQGVAAEADAPATWTKDGVSQGTFNGTLPTEKGVYTITYTCPLSSAFQSGKDCWNLPSPNSHTIRFEIVDTLNEITPPHFSSARTFKYDGNAKSVTLAGFDSNTMTKESSSVENATTAGIYKVYVTPKDGNCWSDDKSTATRALEWGIVPSGYTEPFGADRNFLKTLENSPYRVAASALPPGISGGDILLRFPNPGGDSHDFVHIFTNTAASGFVFENNSGSPRQGRVLIVGGGGGSGSYDKGAGGLRQYCNAPGGGGGGGVKSIRDLSLLGAYSIVVGAGGMGGSNRHGENGMPSSIASAGWEASAGGGGGGARSGSNSHEWIDGYSGATGGGGSGYKSASADEKGKAGTANGYDGYDGGAAAYSSTWYYYKGGAGGGAGATGPEGGASGGLGFLSDILWDDICFGGGGSGGVGSDASGTTCSGGLGGGGGNYNDGWHKYGQTGVCGLGGGGGAPGYTSSYWNGVESGVRGGDGIVIIRYTDTVQASKIKTVEVPEVPSFVYNHQLQDTGIRDTEDYTVSDDVAGMYIQEYTITLTLRDPDNMQWSDGTTQPQHIKWYIRTDYNVKLGSFYYGLSTNHTRVASDPANLNADFIFRQRVGEEYRYVNIFTNNHTSVTIPSMTADILLIGGGGGGGAGLINNGAGGGGAGGVVLKESQALNGTYSITIGAGGSRGSGGSAGGNGGETYLSLGGSQVSGLIAHGGGGGAGGNGGARNGKDGASGGGAAGADTTPGGTAGKCIYSGEGHDGGSYAGKYGGGGGGAGAPGGQGTGYAGSQNGGNGVSLPILGYNEYFGGGGAGQGGVFDYEQVKGGLGGGGNGVWRNANPEVGDGMDGQGGGGGSSGFNSQVGQSVSGGRGGCGLVVIVYSSAAGKEIDKPVLTKGAHTFTGSAIDVTDSLTSKDHLVFNGTWSATNVGTYTFTAQPEAGYCWTGTDIGDPDSQTPIVFEWSIVAKPIQGNITVSPIPAQTYTGSPITPEFEVRDTARNVVLTLGTDYTAEYFGNVNIGTATIKLTGIGNYTATENTTFQIIANPNENSFFVTPEGGGSGTGWEDPTTLANALSASASSDKPVAIYMKKGTYTDGNWTLPLADNAQPVSILGGYEGLNLVRSATEDSILDGDGSKALLALNVGQSSQVTLTRLTFKDGGSSTAAALSKAGLGNLSVAQCKFIGNGRMGAFSSTDDGDYDKTLNQTDFTDCAFIGNNSTSSNGALMLNHGTTFDHCLFAKNTGSGKSGAVYVVKSKQDYVFRNCTFVANSASGTDGAGSICMYHGTGKAYNSIFHGTGVQVSGRQDGPLTCNYCLFNPGGAQGNANTTINNPIYAENPQFADISGDDATAWDVHLKSTQGRYKNGEWVTEDTVSSPAIDAGDPAADCSAEPKNSAGQNFGLNLGVYGNTAQASMSPVRATVTVTLDKGEGSGGTPSVTGLEGTPMPAVSVPMRENYNFMGYFTATAGGGTKYYDENGQPVASPKFSTSVTALYAYWEAATVTVTLNANGGSDGATTSVTATNGQPMPTIAAANLPTRTGYTFAGFFENQDGTGKQYYNANGTSANNYDKTAASTIYAKWTANKYRVHFNGNGETSGSMGTEGQLFTYDVEQKLTKNQFARVFTVSFAGGFEGQVSPLSATATFNGWAKSKDGAAEYGDEAPVKNLSSTHGAQIDLYAKWTDGSITLPTPTKTGCTFVGWYTAASGGSKVGDAGASYTPTATTTLYAQWLTQVAKPTAKTGLVYNGSEQTGVAAATGYTVENGKKTNAGNYTATAKLASGYCWNDGTTGDESIPWLIDAAPLTLTPAHAAITYGDAKPTDGFSWTGSGYVGGQTSVVVTGTPSYSTTYEQGSNVGSYPITLSGLSAPNYAITFAEGALAVNQAENVWTTTPAISKTTYKANDPATLTPGVARFGTVAATIAKDGAAATTFFGTLPTDVGSYELTYSVAETQNYMGLSETLNFTVTEAAYDLHAISATGPVIKDVPSSWLAAAFPSVADYQDAFLSTNVNGVTGWAAYILGFEGSDVSTAAIIEKTTQSTMVGDNVTLTVGLPDMPKPTRTTEAGCEVKYSLLTSTDAETLRKGGGDVVAECEKCAESSFTVPAPAANHVYYRIRIHFIFAGGGGGVTELFSYVGQVDRSNLPTGWTAGGDTTANLKSGLIDVPESCKGNGYIRISFDSKVKYNHCRLDVAFRDANGATLTGIDVLKSIGDSLGAGRDTFEPTMVVYRVPAGADVSKIQLQWLNTTAVPEADRREDDVEVKDIKVESLDYLTAATDIDTIFSASVNQDAYDTAKSAHFDTSKADWTRGLKGLHDALVDGGGYDILVMGDSLCEAPINGGLEALIKRQWPQSNVRVHVCWSNNTGCPQFLGTSTRYSSSEAEGYYRELDFTKYDCVIFSGTTQARYAPTWEILSSAITTIRNKIKEDNPNCSVVFLAPQLSVDSRYFSPWGTASSGDYWDTAKCFFVAYGNACAARTDFAVASDGWAAKDYNIMSATLPTLTENLGMAYWDLYEFSYDYLFRSGKPYFYYSRDAQHSSEYNRVLSAKQLFEVFKLVAAKDFTTP